MKTIVILIIAMLCTAYADKKKKVDRKVSSIKNKCHDSLKVPLYRYWNGVDHFYTTNWNELGSGKNGYRYEGIQCKVWKYLQPGSTSLYRYYNGKDHFYTTSTTEIGTTVPGTKGKHGYTSEGVTGFCYPAQLAGTIPLYRYWNGVDHFYTTDINEIGTSNKGQKGRYNYVNEGVACYVFAAK